VFPTAAEAAMFPTFPYALPRFPQLAEANCGPCTPPPLPRLWKSPQRTARACPRRDPRHPRVVAAAAPASKRKPKPAPVPSDCPPWRRRRGFGLLLRGNRVPLCRCNELGLHPARHPPKRIPDLIAVDQTGVRRRRRCRSLEQTAALGPTVPTACAARRSPGFAVSVSFRVCSV
jgi:hypothetical protein